MKSTPLLSQVLPQGGIRAREGSPATPTRGASSDTGLGEARLVAFNARMNLADFSQLELRDHAGQPVRLGSLWTERPVVLVFLRHFG